MQNISGAYGFDGKINRDLRRCSFDDLLICYRSPHATSDSVKIVHIYQLPLGRKQIKILENSMTFSFYRRLTTQKQICTMNDKPICFVYCFSRYIQSRTLSGRCTLHLLIGATDMKFPNREST